MNEMWHFAITLILANPLINAEGPIKCGPTAAMANIDYFGINWDYKNEYPEVPKNLYPEGSRAPQYEVDVQAYVYCYYYLPEYYMSDGNKKEGLQVSHILYTNSVPGHSTINSDKIGVMGRWFKQSVCGGIGYFPYFVLNKDNSQYQDFVKRCRHYQDDDTFRHYYGAQPHLAHPFQFPWDPCASVFVGGMVEVKSFDESPKSIIYVEPETSGRMRLVDIEANMCLLRKTGKPQNLAEVLRRPKGVNWFYKTNFRPTIKYVYSGYAHRSFNLPEDPDEQITDIGALRTEQIFCIYTNIDSTGEWLIPVADKMLASSYFNDRALMNGEWTYEYVCDGMGFFRVFKPKDTDEFLCGVFRACQNDIGMMQQQVVAMQPGWAAAFMVETGNPPVKRFFGSYLEIFNAETIYDVRYRRSMFWGDLYNFGVINKKALEKSICVPEKRPR